MNAKLVLLKLVIALLFLFISACSTLKNEKVLFPDINKVSLIEDHEKKQEGRINQHLDCAYSVRKGIAEIIRVSDSTIFLTFVPGDILFKVDSDFLTSRNISPHKHMEFKATYTRPIEGNSADCPKTDPELILK